MTLKYLTCDSEPISVNPLDRVETVGVAISEPLIFLSSLRGRYWYNTKLRRGGGKEVAGLSGRGKYKSGRTTPILEPLSALQTPATDELTVPVFLALYSLCY